MFDNWRHMLYIALVESILHIHQNRKALSQHKGFDYLLLGEKEKKLTFFFSWRQQFVFCVLWNDYDNRLR